MIQNTAPYCELLDKTEAFRYDFDHSTCTPVFVQNWGARGA